MRYSFVLIMATVLVLVLGFLMIGSTGASEADEEKPWMEPEIPVIVFDEHCCTCDDCAQNECGEAVNGDAKLREALRALPDRAEFEMSRGRMVAEVEMLWTMYFDDDNAKATDSRRDRFPELAEYLVDSVIMYQDAPTDIGGQLPGHKNDHLVVAYMAAKESSVTPDIVNESEDGKGEVCLFQLHGKALAGYSAEKVRHNAQLCTMLGVRWIASQIPKCSQDGAGIFGDEFEWEDADWIGPLSVYAGGPKAIRRDGRCAQFGAMRDRVDAIRMFRTRIDHEMQYQGD